MSAILENDAGPSGQPLYSLAVRRADQIVQAVPTTQGEHFVLFLAWDARDTPDEEILLVARQLVRAGLAYIVAWGPDCERVHDLFDQVDIEQNPESNVPETDTVIMSTWHDSESLEEALWFAIYSAYPTGLYETTWRATIAAAVGSPEWASTMHAYLSNLESLNSAVGLSGP